MSRGRGQPPKIEPERYGELLGLLRDGLSMTAAAKQMGIARATLYNLRDRVPQMGEAMRRVQDAARAEKRAAHQPSESCYVNNQCRSPECRAAATEARARRRTATPAPVTVLPTPTRVSASVYDVVAGTPPPLADSA